MRIGIAVALISAALFGASTPFAKALLGLADPWLLAGILYLGSGVGLGALLVSERLRASTTEEANISRRDIPWLLGAVVAGGIVGPVALMLGLVQTTASSASLLLNLEGLATMGIAWIVFRENVDRRLLIGAASILAGASVLSWQGGPMGFGAGSLMISVACVAWGIDNNLTRKVSAANPVQIAALKGLIAGSTNLALALLQGAAFPPPAVLAGSALVGFFGYGVSLVLFVIALRHLGAARTGAYFSTAPFVGGLLGVLMLHEPLTVRFGAGALLMALGVWLHVTEQHEHDHTHEPLVHDHSHTHDEHHAHAHGVDDPNGEPHTHQHTHARLVHRHPHFPDLHHQHGH